MMKSLLAGLTALIACPCHLPLTLPAILALTSGTAVGLWLSTNLWLIWLCSSLLFAGGLALAFLWFNQGRTVAQCEIPANRQTPPHDQLSHVTKGVDRQTQVKERFHV